MNVEATINFTNGSKLFLISDFFEKELVDEISQCFLNVDHSWKVIPEFEYPPGRLVYQGNSPVLDKITEYCNKTARWVGEHIGHRVRFKEFALWLDQPGYYLPPHMDVGGLDHALQIYLGNQTTLDKKLGFSVYNNDHKPLLQLAYAHNTGYILDNPHAVVHGMEEPIQFPHQRWSVYVRYFKVWST